MYSVKLSMTDFLSLKICFGTRQGFSFLLYCDLDQIEVKGRESNAGRKEGMWQPESIHITAVKKRRGECKDQNRDRVLSKEKAVVEKGRRRKGERE